MITFSIDLTKIKEVAKFTKSEKNGHIYQNLVVDKRKEPDQYGNTHTVYISQSKEEREAKTQTPILGNVKIFYTDSAEAAPQAAAIDEDIPF